MRPICVQRMSHEDANAENDTRYRDELGHGFSPPCLTRKSSPGSLPDDFAELGNGFVGVAIRSRPGWRLVCRFTPANGSAIARFPHQISNFSRIGFSLIERLLKFHWGTMAGIALAALGGAHMTVAELIEKLSALSDKTARVVKNPGPWDGLN